MAYHWAPTPDGSSLYPWVDSGCVELLGLEPAQFLADGGQFWRLVHPDDRTPLKLAKLKAQRQGTRLRHICRITTASGEAKLIEIVAYPLPPSGALWSAVALDISEGQRRLDELQQLQQALEQQQQQAYQQARSLAEAHAALARLSTVDSPTGLPNRLHFEHSLMRAVSLAQRHGLPLTLVWLKLQGLHQCNVRDGFLAGDRALQAFAGLLGSSLGQGETAGRLGGVDFAVLLPERDLAGAQQWLADLQERVDASEALRAANLSMGQGLAECLVDDTADELLLRADAALRRPA
jgi:diguanylate cyclase (GGDEF)-like protein